MSDLVTLEVEAGLATVTLNRPDKLNALNVPLFEALKEHTRKIAQQQDSIGCVIVKGAGKGFSAGHDMDAMQAGEVQPYPSFYPDIIEQLATLPQPVIMGIHGFCFTGALELALAGDLLVGSRSCLFGDTHAKYALTPVWGLSQRLPRRVGQARAREMMYTCRSYTGEQAQDFGLIDYCVDDDNWEAECAALAREILQNSWFSLRANKRLLMDTDGLSLEQGLAHEWYRNEGTGPDMEQRFQAYRDRKR